jgi:hypothetical protein
MYPDKGIGYCPSHPLCLHNAFLVINLVINLDAAHQHELTGRDKNGTEVPQEESV